MRRQVSGVSRRAKHGATSAIRSSSNPRPFTWTKTADEILHSLAEYLDKIRASPPETGCE
jgi:hypothetical protein